MEGRSHLVKGVFGKESYEVLVWDMRAMWVENVEREELAERMKVIEAPNRDCCPPPHTYVDASSSGMHSGIVPLHSIFAEPQSQHRGSGLPRPLPPLLPPPSTALRVHVHSGHAH